MFTCTDNFFKLNVASADFRGEIFQEIQWIIIIAWVDVLSPCGHFAACVGRVDIVKWYPLLSRFVISKETK